VAFAAASGYGEVGSEAMTHDEHTQRHRELHKAFDELLADYMEHHPSQTTYLSMPLSQLLLWSHSQTIDADDLRESYVP
jgi:hypothetical protein